MPPRLWNSNETKPIPLGNASLHVARFAQAGRWLNMLSDRVAKRNSYVGRLKAAVYADMVGSVSDRAIEVGRVKRHYR